MAREFHQTARTGKTRVWAIEVDGKYVHTTFGELGGKLQTVTDEGQAKNVGRSNEVTPEEDAVYLAERAILKKTRNGYRPVGEKAPDRIVWEDGFLPENLRFYKPTNTLSKTLEKKVNDGSAWLGRKRDGEMMVIVKWDDGHVDILSRTMLPNHHQEAGIATWNDRFPEMVAEVERREDIPPRSILLGDVVCDPVARLRWDVASFMKSKTAEARKKPPLFFYCWDVAWWEGECLLKDTPVRERYDVIWTLLGSEWDKKSWLLPIEVYEVNELESYFQDEELPDTPIEAAMELAKRWEWEGWVVVDPDGTMGNKGHNFRGKTDRPGKASGKLKPVYEGDFVAFFDPDGDFEGRESTAGKWGRGKHRGQVGSVSLFQYDSAGELVYICECGGGIDDEFRAKYSDPEEYPIVVEVEFNDRTYKSKGEKTNALQFPRIVRVREDKTADECINEEL